MKVCNNHSLWVVGCWLSSQFQLYETNRRAPYVMCTCVLYHSAWTGAKGAREIFLSFFLLWPKKYFCGFTRFRQFYDLFTPIIFFLNLEIFQVPFHIFEKLELKHKLEILSRKITFPIRPSHFAEHYLLTVWSNVTFSKMWNGTLKISKFWKKKLLGWKGLKIAWNV